MVYFFSRIVYVLSIEYCMNFHIRGFSRLSVAVGDEECGKNLLRMVGCVGCRIFEVICIGRECFLIFVLYKFEIEG